jgi:hypothetical protein
METDRDRDAMALLLEWQKNRLAREGASLFHA